MKKPVSKPVLKVRVIASTHHFEIQYAVWLGGTQVAYCDTRTRADLLAHALSEWQKTQDYDEWLHGRVLEGKTTKT